MEIDEWSSADCQNIKLDTLIDREVPSQIYVSLIEKTLNFQSNLLLILPTFCSVEI